MTNEINGFGLCYLVAEQSHWEELAAAARFLTGVYRASFRAEAMAVSTPEAPPSLDQLVAAFLIRHYASLSDQAYAVYLGARAAAAERRAGPFSTPSELLSRIAEAGGSGAIIQGFVNAARTLVIADTLFKGDTGPEVAEARDRASQDMFDGTLTPR